MAGETIYLQDVLQQMRTLNGHGKAPVFSVKFRTYQRNSKTGGRLVHYPTAKMVMKEENPNINSVRSLQTVSKPKPKMRKNPNHFENKTRNIKVLPQGDIKTLNIRCLVEYNGKKVIY